MSVRPLPVLRGHSRPIRTELLGIFPPPDRPRHLIYGPGRHERRFLEEAAEREPVQRFRRDRVT